MTTLPITVLVHEGPQARYYLAALNEAGYRPAQIVYILWTKNAPKWLRFFPPLRKRLLRRYQVSSQWHWPNWLMGFQKDLFLRITQECKKWDSNAHAIIETALSPGFSYQEYADQYLEIHCENYKDPKLRDFVAGFEFKTVLFTGGGILPKSLLQIPAARFIHFHPGDLPFVRGGDGFLWSMLLYHRPSVSGFFMVPGIDLGPIFTKKHFFPLSIKVPSLKEVKEENLYRALFSVIDPLMRALTLFDVCKNNSGKSFSFEELPAIQQVPEEGLTFNFMHRRLRSKILNLIFSEAGESGP